MILIFQKDIKKTLLINFYVDLVSKEHETCMWVISLSDVKYLNVIAIDLTE